MSTKKYFFSGESDRPFNYLYFDFWKEPKCQSTYEYCLKFHTNSCPRHAALWGNPFTRPLPERSVTIDWARIPITFQPLVEWGFTGFQEASKMAVVKIFAVRLVPKDKEEFKEVNRIEMTLQVENLEAALSYVEKNYPSLEVEMVLEGYRQA